MKCIMIFISFVISIFAAGMVYGASIPNELLKLGQGKAYYLKFIKVYDAALYASSNAEAEGILNEKVSKCLQLDYAVGVKRDDFIRAANTVLDRQFSKEQLARVQKELDSLHLGYSDVSEGDNYTLCYDGESRITTLSLNGNTVTSISSAEFSQVYFSIWLGSAEPLDSKLRNDLIAAIQGN